MTAWRWGGREVEIEPRNDQVDDIYSYYLGLFLLAESPRLKFERSPARLDLRGCARFLQSSTITSMRQQATKVNQQATTRAESPL